MENQSNAQYVLNISDRYGRTVKYSTKNWEKHKISHPEMVEYIDEIGLTVSDPDLELESDSGVSYLYRRHVGNNKFKYLWMLVIVGYSSGTGNIRTAYFTSKINQEGQITWMKPELLMRKK